MKKRIKKLIMIFIIILLLIIIGFSLTQKLKEIKIKGFEIEKVQNVSLIDFTLKGNLFVENPNRIRIPIKKIHYRILLNTNETLATGEMENFVLEPKKINKIPITKKIVWITVPKFATEFMKNDKVLLKIETELYFDIKGLRNKKIEFSEEKDIKKYLKEKGFKIL